MPPIDVLRSIGGRSRRLPCQAGDKATKQNTMTKASLRSKRSKMPKVPAPFSNWGDAASFWQWHLQTFGLPGDILDEKRPAKSRKSRRSHRSASPF